MLQIHGLNKTTLLDYPGRVAATVFLGGCNLRCPFCHNSGLVLSQETQPIITQEEFFTFLIKRKNILQGVCVTGGEPTISPGLNTFLKKIKLAGYPVKLDTNGLHPEVLEELLCDRLVDYIAMDIKGSPRNYGRCTGMFDLVLEPVLQSISLLKQSDIPYEFRTTVVKELHTVEEFKEIGAMLKGATQYFLQAYRDGADVICPGFHSMEEDEMRKAAELMRQYVGQVGLRGIETT